LLSFTNNNQHLQVAQKLLRNLSKQIFALYQPVNVLPAAHFAANKSPSLPELEVIDIRFAPTAAEAFGTRPCDMIFLLNRHCFGVQAILNARLCDS